MYSVPRVPKLGDGFRGKNLGTVNVVLVDGDNLDEIKDQFGGKKATVVIDRAERSAFVPTTLRGSASSAPAPAPPRAEMPIRGGPPPAASQGGRGESSRKDTKDRDSKKDRDRDSKNRDSSRRDRDRDREPRGGERRREVDSRDNQRPR